MTFYPNDMYFASGSTSLYNCWTENVTKFNSDTFYNWEQDNEPLYDLEERSFYAWEKLGFPSSSIPGINLTVSADAVIDVDADGNPDCRTNLFHTLSAAVEAIPDRVNFPVLIEVGSFGNLGEVHINGIEFGPSGSLEIINRNFAKGYAENTKASAVDTSNEDDLVSHISGAVVSATFRDTSCMDISTAVFSATYDERTQSEVRAVTQFPGYDSDSGNNVMTTHLSVSLDAANAFGSDPSTISLPPFAVTTSSADICVSSENAGVNLGIGSLGNLAISNGDTRVNSLVYCNHLEAITVKDCNGPVYLRNFFVDGKETKKDGVRIENSSDVLLENMASVRCTENGFLVRNSDVKVTRGIAAWRCYGLSGGNRISPAWNLDHAAIPPMGIDSAAGLRAQNSNLTFSSTLDLEPTYASGNDFLINFSRNANGVVLENSTLTGGIKRSILPTAETASYFTVESNVERGIYCKNSIIDLDGRLRLIESVVGIELVDSKIILDELYSYISQKEAIKAENSYIIYNKNNHVVPVMETKYDENHPILNVPGVEQVEFRLCGRPISLVNSNMKINSTSAIDTSFGTFKILLTHGTSQGNTKDSDQIVNVPAVTCKNSDAEFWHTRIESPDYTGVAVSIANSQPVYGSCVRASDNSHVTFKGSLGGATIFEGPEGYTTQKRMCGAYASNNSTLEFNGPTAMMKFGVDVLSENGSNIVFQPHRKEGAGLDISALDLTNTQNHTSVELHSTKACLVANKNSSINIIDVGECTTNWADGPNGSLALLSGVSYDSSGDLDLRTYTSGGSFQFFPNPTDVDSYPPGIANITPPSQDVFSQVAGGRFNHYITGAEDAWNIANQNNLSAITNGGMCVRALGDSTVNVINSNFQCGWWNPSAAIYDASTGLTCDRTFIWNIADNSVLNASYVSVSSLHPEDAGYHGPSGVWTSSTAAYGAPPGTPDTSSLSVLDSFGEALGNILPRPGGGTLIPFGPQSFENRGPFRLYFSVDSLANYLTDPAQDTYGVAYQLFSQGYAASGDLSCAPSVSALWDDSYVWNDAGTGFTQQQYYYTSSMTTGNPQVMLDRAAANMFANAKHCASKKSGRKKLVTIMDSHQSKGGEAATNDNKDFGMGFRSSNVFDLGRDE